MLLMDYDKIFSDALNSVLEDYSNSKIRFYSERDLQGHFVMIDEDGRHVRRIATGSWKAIPVKRGRRKKPSHYLHAKQDGRRCVQKSLG